MRVIRGPGLRRRFDTAEGQGLDGPKMSGVCVRSCGNVDLFVINHPASQQRDLLAMSRCGP